MKRARCLRVRCRNAPTMAWCWRACRTTKARRRGSRTWRSSPGRCRCCRSSIAACSGRTTLAIDAGAREEWRDLDAPRAIVDGRFTSRPGVFAWDRIDPASALLAKHLPADLAGRGADLGAGWGYLATEVLARAPEVDRARPVRSRSPRAGHWRAPTSPREARARVPLARRGAGPAAPRLRLHREQSAVPCARARGPARHRAALHQPPRPMRCARAGGCSSSPIATCRTKRCSTRASRTTRTLAQARRLQGGRSGARQMKLVKHLANLGYGSRKEVAWMFREGRVTDAAGRGAVRRRPAPRTTTCASTASRWIRRPASC